MSPAPNIDGVLIQWGDRLFYPGNWIVRGRALPNLRGRSTSERDATIRARIQATVVRRAPEVMVKVTGSGRGMNAIAAHFRYSARTGDSILRTSAERRCLAGTYYEKWPTTGDSVEP